MPTLNELLSINLGYHEILDAIEEATDDFTEDEGEIAFDDQFESEVAKSILENHYRKVEDMGLDVIDGEKSVFKLVFSDLIIDDFDFPKEEIEYEEPQQEEQDES